jgi:hypothetical protein
VVLAEKLEFDGEAHVARADDVLHFEVCELHVESTVLYDFGVFLGGQFGEFAVLSPGAHDFAFYLGSYLRRI